MTVQAAAAPRSSVIEAPRSRIVLPRKRIWILVAQLTILGTILTAWQVLTGIPWFRTNTFMDPFFINRAS